MSIELRQLQFAVHAAETGSFSSAAQDLSVQQATLSRQILQLESVLGLPLFERTRRGAVPTPAGAQLLQRAARILAQVEALQHDATSASDGADAILTVGYFTPLASGNLRAALGDFQRDNPGVRLAGVECGRSDLLSRLEGGLVDVAIAIGSHPRETTHRQILWMERMLVALPSFHRLVQADQVFWTDLRDDTFLGERFSGPELAKLIQSRLAQPGYEPTIELADISRESLMMRVAIGLGVTLVAESSAGARIEGVALRELHDGDSPCSIAISAYWRPENSRAPLRTFIEFLRARLNLVDIEEADTARADPGGLAAIARPPNL